MSPKILVFWILKNIFGKKLPFVPFTVVENFFQYISSRKSKLEFQIKWKGKDSRKTIFECERWFKSRRESFLELGNLTKENLVYMMLEGAEQ